MKFVQVSRDTVVNANSIDKITKDVDGFAIVHVGLDQIKSSFPYESFLSLVSIEDKVGNGPSPVATALAY